MQCILAIDTATPQASVALRVGNQVWCEPLGQVAQQSAQILTTIDSLLSQASSTRAQLQAILVTQGPGSFAGVRLGLCVAQSMAWVLQLPVIPVSSLAACAFSALQQETQNVIPRITAVLDARMQEIYLGTYEGRGAAFKMYSEDAMAPITALPQQWAGCAAINLIEPTYTVGHIASILLEMQQLCHLPTVSALDLLPVYLRNNVAQVATCKK